MLVEDFKVQFLNYPRPVPVPPKINLPHRSIEDPKQKQLKLKLKHGSVKYYNKCYGYYSHFSL